MKIINHDNQERDTMLKFICYPKCTTCKSAKKWLDENTVELYNKDGMDTDYSVLKFKYEPHKAEAGAFHKVVQIYTNTAQGEHLIMIQGNSVVKRRQKQ